jgi:hypothetical protein
VAKTKTDSHQSEQPNTSEVIVPVNEIPGPDFTVYLERSFENNFLESEQDRKGQQKKEKKEAFSYPCSVRIKNRKTKALISGRALACRAYSGKLVSITLRCEAKNVRKAEPVYGSEQPANLAYRKRLKQTIGKYSREKPSVNGRAQDYLGYCPDGHPGFDSWFTAQKGSQKKAHHQSGKEIFLNDIYPLCYQIYRLLLSDTTTTPSGLVVITGATDSSKSLITRGLIFLFLEAAAKRALEKGLRKPHLVTFEDPVEQLYVKDPGSSTVPDRKTLLKLLDGIYLDYTPREKGLDADNLADVIKDSLRQTPSVFFVGETREKRDWQALLEFAGSGHLVVTTSHASSVVEAMTRIFRHTKTRTPAQRSEIAKRVLAIINIRHLKPRPTATPDTRKNKQKSEPARAVNVRSLLPALWKSTSQSKNNLIADGLASLLPALGREEEIGYYSRTYFVEKLTADATILTDGFKKHSDKEREQLLKEIRRQAIEWDIEGV